MLKIENKLEKYMKYGYRINTGGTTAFIQYYIPHIIFTWVKILGASLSAFALSEDILFCV
jgi:hypothetical protein